MKRDTHNVSSRASTSDYDLLGIDVQQLGVRFTPFERIETVIDRNWKLEFRCPFSMLVISSDLGEQGAHSR